MKKALSVAALVVALVGGLSAAVTAAESPREVHGHSDGFIGPGVAIAWAVLRGPTEAATDVVLRIEVDHSRLDSVGIEGIDPFGGARRQRLPRTPLATPTEVRISRSQFADAPRTELRFYPPRSETPAYTMRRAEAFEKYRKGNSTATSYPESDRAKLSDTGK